MPAGDTPFGPGTASLGLYTDPAPARTMLDRLFAQAAAASSRGVSGLTISEHHGGFPGYLPNPIQVVGWILDRVDGVWAGPCPLLLPLRPPAMVAEELCWLAALHPGHVGAGFAPGYLASDFELFDAELEHRARVFSEGLSMTAALISGVGSRLLGEDPAVSLARQVPVPFVAAAGSPGAARRAAHAGGGMLTDSLMSVDRIRELFELYVAAGGTGPRVVNRRIWIGPLPEERLRSQLARFADAENEPSRSKDRAASFVHGTTAEVAEQLVAAVGSTGATHLGLKFHLAGVSQDEALNQIDALAEVLPTVVGALARTGAR